jgi:glycosyltransferase involved in cell wall biosynthesis
MRRIAVLFLGRKGAGPVYTYEMICALSNYAELLVVLSSYIDNKDVWDKKAVEDKNIKPVYIKTYRSKCQFILSFFNAIRFIKIIKTINSYNPDMLYSAWVHYWDPFIYPFLKCKLKIKTIHDVEIKKGEDGMGWRYLRYFSFKHANKYIILSKKYRRNLVAKGIDENSIIVIPHAGFAYYKGQENEADVTFHNKLLFFGRIVEYKGLQVLFDALKLIIETNPKIKLVVAGDGDLSPYKKDIELLKENLEIYNRWIPNDEVKKYFNAADISVLPYTEATQSGIIPLSYSFSKPVIASNVGALAEQIIDKETGFLVEPNNPPALSEAILKLMTSPELLFKMSKKCGNYYRTELTWDSSAKKIMALLAC